MSLPIPSHSLLKSLATNSTPTIPLSLNQYASSSSNSTIYFQHKSLKFPHEQCKRLLTTKTKVSFFPSFLTKSKDSKVIKEELVEAIEPLDRGAYASSEDQQIIDQLTCKLEAVNQIREPLKSDLLNGKWELIYTTSESILQTKRPKLLRSRVNYQAINLDTLRAQNMETWPFFNQVTANLMPLNTRKVAVKFDHFRIFGLGQGSFSNYFLPFLPVHPKKLTTSLPVPSLNSQTRFNIKWSAISLLWL